MSGSKQGILASYDYLDSAVDAIGALRKAGFKRRSIKAFAPVPEHDLEHAMGYHSSPMQFFALGEDNSGNGIDGTVPVGSGLSSSASLEAAAATLLEALGRKGVSRLMVEGGAGVITTVLGQQLADLVVLTIAPSFVGGLRAFKPNGQSFSPAKLQHVGYTRLGEDLIVWGIMG